MKRKNLIRIVLIILVISVTACNKKIVPSIAVNKDGKRYDQAAFNYVYVEAVKQKLMGNGGDALKYLEQCVLINPASDASYYQMAQILVASGDVHNGKKYILKAVSLDDQNLWYLMMLAGMYYQEKNLDSALIYYEKAVKSSPENENLQLTLGNLYSENKNYSKAADVFNSFDNKYGINEASTVSAIKNLIGEKKFDEALTKAELLVEKYPDQIIYNGLLADIYGDKGDSIKALEVYNKMLEKKPDDPAVQLSLCDFLLSEKMFDDVFVLFESIILNNAVTREDKISLAVRMIGMADLIKEQGDNLMIELMVLEANYKEDNVIPLLRPELLIAQNKLADASVRLEEIIKIEPDNYYAWEKLLLIYMQMGDFNHLMIRGEECSTRFNMSFLAKILYANAATESKKYDIALEELRKAEIIAGNNKDSMIQVLTMRADVYYRMNDYTNAFKVFDQALGYNKDDLTILNNYAYFLAEQNTRLKEAEEMAKKVIDTDKNNTTFLDTYAWVLYKRGKIGEASRIMESIINRGEKPDAEWYEHYGFILKKQKKCDEAVKNWNIALSIDKSKQNLIREIENCKN